MNASDDSLTVFYLLACLIFNFDIFLANAIIVVVLLHQAAIRWLGTILCAH